MNALQTYFPASTSFPPMLFGPTPIYFCKRGWCVNDPKQIPLFVTDSTIFERRTQAGVLSSSPVATPALPLDWILDPAKQTSLLNRVLARLVQLEAHEANPHFKSDYRQAFICLTLAGRGNTEPFTVASYSVHGCHPDKVWPKILADRRAKLGKPKKPQYSAVTSLQGVCGLGAETQSAPLLHFPKKESA